MIPKLRLQVRCLPARASHNKQRNIASRFCLPVLGKRSEQLLLALQSQKNLDEKLIN
jgi:hypothetical protein